MADSNADNLPGSPKAQKVMFGTFTDGTLRAILVDTDGKIQTTGASGGTSITDDTAFTPASTAVTPVGYFADETAPDSVDEGDVGVARMTLNRKAYAVIADPTAENAAGVDASGHLQMDIAAVSAGLKAPSSLATGTRATASDTALAISSTSVTVVEVLVQADTANATEVFIGDSSSQVIPLFPLQYIVVPIDDVNKVFMRRPAGAANVTVNFFGAAN